MIPLADMPPCSSPLSENQAAIIRNCAVAVQTAMQDGTAPRVLFFDNYVVKFNEVDILNEGDTQAFVYTAFKCSPDAPRVAEIYECFSWGGFQYLVMERVDLPTVETWINDATSEAEARSRDDVACQAVANALRWLFALSPPVGAEIGLIEGAYTLTQSADIRAKSGFACHPFFGDYRAPYRYPNAAALQRHINRALSYYRPRRASPLAVEISEEPSLLVHGDIKPCNFLIDPKTLRVTIIDFGGISVLPRSFVCYSLHATRDTFITGINKFLGWKQSDNFLAMSAAAGVYWQVSSKRLGLDKDGFPLRKVPGRTSLPLSVSPLVTVK